MALFGKKKGSEEGIDAQVRALGAMAKVDAELTKGQPETQAVPAEPAAASEAAPAGEGETVFRTGGAGDPIRTEVRLMTDMGQIEQLKDRLQQLAAQSSAGLMQFSSAGAKPPAKDPVEQLTKLADLRDRGVLTDEEFAAQKAKILGES
jgi:hypothetical protein